jgi:transposase-like protein
MVLIPVSCPYCQSDQVVKRGKTNTGKQRYRCQNPECSHQSFLRDPAYRGRLPAIKQQVIEMSLNGRGIRDTARVLKISTATVIQERVLRSAPQPLQGGEGIGATSQTELALEVVDAEVALMPFPL